MWTCAGVLALVACACAVTRDQFYPHGLGLDQNLPRGSDVPAPEVPLKVPIKLYGESYDTIYVNNYGVLTFRADISSFLNIEFPLPYPSIAVFYSNIDTTQVGAVYYRETDEPHVLSKAEESVQNNFHDYQDFKPTSVFITTWEDVTYSSNGQSSDKRNRFQAAIINNGTESFVEFLYPERDIQWIQKDTQVLTLPDAKAQAGFVSEDGRLYILRGSGSHQIRNIVAWSNVHEPGRYVFRIGNIAPESNIAVPDQYNQNEVEIEEETKTCAQSGPSVCHINARCVDYQAGICCQCNDGYYGNGKSCIKDDVPLRVHGKINGIINNVNLNDVDIQSYVVVADGRAYTALSLIPSEIGSSLQLLHVLGGVVGWLFAKPSGSAKNGYQLTGSLFNHTADIWFPATGDRVTVHQEYLGHDVFDQITLEIDVRGSLPAIVPGTKLDITDYDEQYSLVEPGLIRSESSRTFTNKVTGEKYVQKVSQTFSFNSCRFAPASVEDNTPSTLKINKNYLGYEPRENIVRYGLSNKIFPLGEEDPCIQGRNTCGPHSSCVVQGNSFACICDSGFTSTYDNKCVDIDECGIGTHNCDSNADCNNYDGGFQCRCRQGFIGNGLQCNRLPTCQDKKCDSNARCIENPGGEPICECNPGYNGNGQYCQPNYQNTCGNCSPYASCIFIDNNYICRCNAGFSGDGYNCQQDAREDDMTRTPPTDENNESDYNNTVVLPNCDLFSCTCPEGYTEYRDTYNNQLCRIINYYQSSDNNYQEPTDPYYQPPTESYYQTSTEPRFPTSTENNQYQPPEHNYQQTLDENYPSPPPNQYQPVDNYPYPTQTNYQQGAEQSSEQPPQNNNHSYTGVEYPVPDNDPLIRCEDDSDCPPNAVCSYLSPDASSDWEGKHCVCPEGYEGDAFECIEKTGPNCACGPNARCITTRGDDYICVCDLGYHGDGYSCRPNFSCKNNSDCEYNAECRLDPKSNEYICQCLNGYMKDQNDACIPDAQLCNGAWCAEHASCLYDNELDLNYCHCDDGYSGDGISQCVPEGHTCDVTNDCNVNAICTPMDNTYQCICRDGFNGDGYTCIPEATCRNNPNLCDLHASCMKRHDAYVCECNAGYNGNGSHCQLNPRQAGNFLVASDGASIYRVPFKVTGRDFATPFNSGISQIAVGIDVDCGVGRIYWGDVVSYAIKTAAYDGSDYGLFLTEGVKSPEGIAVDWSSRNIFWTDSRKLTIEVANLDTKARKVLFAVDRISNPRGIAVHPGRGKIFWSDWKRTNPKIEWASMDGSQRGVFLDKTDVALPNSLAIDWARDRLCYADAGRASIECVTIDNQERETIATNCSYPFGLAIHGNKFYWTDWKTLRIESYDLETQTRSDVPIATASRRLYGVAVAPDSCPPSQSICYYRNGGCGPDQLCLPDGNNGRTCADADKVLSRR
ncbi:hypothetical protein SFRURICE_009489 [Spodoptera frugiperda]|uniref:SFRICE_026984 n=1 Tax=Spodoptera frugiperda TaxID=7108 RepID=A0A2H1VBC9_SPOFR|nr:hypothetical protein SFRURICE_020345 [Spodoptera frugiperda]KAF9794112.1 hypothetical protein SFRURICE_009489 [Spodoptera frugiperda]